MKKTVLVLAALFAAASLFAQTNFGADYYYMGEYEKAKMNLETELATNPAEANFYLGEVAFAEGDPATAATYYDKALAADPNYMPAQVGKVKLILKSDPVKAAADIKAMQKIYKKNVAFTVALGRAYLDNGMLTEATAKVAEAKKIDIKYPGIYILSGDIAAASDNPDVGVAAGEYEQAKYYDPNYLLSYLKLAQIYEKRNSSVGLENLRTALKIDPDFVIADAIMARIYTTNGYYPEAIASLKLFFEKSPYSVEDIERMARSYYLGEADKLGMTDSLKFAEARKWVDAGLAKDPDHFVLNRYQMYLGAQMDDPATAVAEANRFFEVGGADAKYIPMDYTTYGTILKNAGDPQGAIAQYNRAIEIDPDRLDTYTQAVQMALSMKNYAQAADFYQRSIDKKQELDPDAYAKNKLVDINVLGNYYFLAGSTISATKTPDLVAQLMGDAKLRETIATADPSVDPAQLAASPDYFAAAFSRYSLHKAEGFFQQLIDLAPESYVGYYYMARTQNVLHPAQMGKKSDSDAPMQFYGKTVEIIDGRAADTPMTPQMANALQESLTYMAYTYLMSNDTANATKYNDRVLEMNPTDPTALQIQKALNQPAQPAQPAPQQ